MVKKTTFTIINLKCEEHDLEIQFNPNSSALGLYEFLEFYGWGYEFQSNDVFYCPKCLKGLNAPSGRIDIRNYIK